MSGKINRRRVRKRRRGGARLRSSQYGVGGKEIPGHSPAGNPGAAGWRAGGADLPPGNPPLPSGGKQGVKGCCLRMSRVPLSYI